jgi:hypothetical protein
MRKQMMVIGATGVTLILGAGVAVASMTGSASVNAQRTACVEYGKPGSVAGNVMLYDWNHSACPAGTYTISVPQTVTVTVTASPPASSSTAVSPGNTVTVVKPPRQTSTEGEQGILLPVTATDSAANQVLTFKMTGAPAGLTIDANTGVISGQIDNADPAETYAVTVTAVDTTGASGTVTFDWTVNITS